MGPALHVKKRQSQKFKFWEVDSSEGETKLDDQKREV